MAIPATFLLHRSTTGDTHVVQVENDQATSIAAFSPRGGSSYAGLTAALFSPADPDLPWRKGDVLLAHSSTLGFTRENQLIRLRLTQIGRIEVYVSETLYSDAERDPIVSLAFDPFGNLYFAREGSRTIQRFRSDGRGGLTTLNWASVPPTIPWGGDFSFAPDGPLFVSTGLGHTPGRLYKIGLSTDGDPVGKPVAEHIGWKKAYQSNGGDVGGFSFYDGDFVVYSDSRGFFFGVDVEPSLNANPSAASGGVIRPQPVQPQFPGLTLPTLAYQPTASFTLNVRDVAVSRNRLQQFIVDRGVVAGQLAWRKLDGSDVNYRNWEADDDLRHELERLLCRFYAFRVAHRRPPLTYLRQVEPLAGDGSMRTGPECFFEAGPIRRRDAVESFLAYVAHYFWVDIKNKTPWGFDDLDPNEIALLLNSKNLFRPYVPGSLPNDGDAYNHGFNYVHDPDTFGLAFPSDPYEAFEFITGDPAVRDGESFLTGAATVDDLPQAAFNLFRWIRDRISHNDPELSGNFFAYWGYEGEPPLSAFYFRRDHPDFTRGERNYAWPGCQSMSGFCSHILHLMLIPARRVQSYLGDTLDKTHSGVMLRANRWLNLHLDQFYEYQYLMSFWDDWDPTYYFKETDADAEAARYATPFTQPDPDDAQAAADERYRTYEQERIAAGLFNYTDALFRAYVDGKAKQTKAFEGTIRTRFAYPADEAASIAKNFDRQFENRLDAFMLEHADQITGDTPLERYASARDLYDALNAAWWAQR